MRRLEVAEVCSTTLMNFMNSAALDVSDDHVPSPLPAAVQGLRSKDICGAVSDIWQQMQDVGDREMMMTHSGYLKLYSLSRPRLRYDAVLLDEAQDCNPAIAEIVASQACARILVGDEHQAIYGFLGATDALGDCRRRSVAGCTTFRRHLTRSFRFGPNIADVANFVLRGFKRETRPILGCGRHEGLILENTPVPTGASFRERFVDPPFAFVARSNVAVIEMALRVDEANLQLVWVGGVRGYGLRLLQDLCLLAQGEQAHAESARVRRFKSLEAMRAHLKRVDDVDMLARLEIVRRHASEDLLGRLAKLQACAERQEASSGPPPSAAVSLATVHKAKGLEWQTVILGEDFPDPDDLRRGPSAGEAQEANALYVALTRAQRYLRLPATLSALYSLEADAVAVRLKAKETWPLRRNTGLREPCPICAEAVAQEADDETRLVAVGSVSGKRFCSRCASHAPAWQFS